MKLHQYQFCKSLKCILASALRCGCGLLQVLWHAVIVNYNWFFVWACLLWSKLFTDSISFLVDILCSELILEVLRLVNRCLSSSNDSVTKELLESKPDTAFWLIIMESITDPYTTERLSELILHKLATQHATDVQAYWVLWLLLHRIFKLQTSVRWVKI